ncbi:MAG: DNA-directed RNA polymerase subunit beta', partial [Alphaproteobacteria bacterium]|nr:DNA-directed RNA polymerase subunit beta' [Alphaproteobacteria bacterium]
WMVMDIIPVIPPELRPLVALDGGRFATSDLNDLYRRVLNRNNRLKRLLDLNAPDIIIRNEKRMLQESVDALFDNGRRGRAISGANKRPLKSLAEMLKGKQGRFRQNLLGKRVDYSGRSVITVGPELKLHQCGLPKKMALELFRPFVYARLERYGLAGTLKAAKRMVEKERPEVWDVLEEVIREHPVLLNRAPTLHRLGIQAFEPTLVEGKSIQLHPLVCTAFNADFDGDQMAVHVPLSLEAQIEARVLMMSTNNILKPSDGKPIIVPSKDIVMGLYYMSHMLDGLKGEGSVFGGIAEVEAAIFEGTLELHSKIQVRLPIVQEDGTTRYQRFETSPGRVMIYELIPRKLELPFDLVNKLLGTPEINDLVHRVYRYCGQKETVIFVDRIMGLGFTYMTKAGISFGKDDLLVPQEKAALIKETKDLVSEFEQQYLDGLITQGEKYNKVVDAWSRCTDKVADAMMNVMSAAKPGETPNSVYMMTHSKARGSVAQMKQLAGMRGLMTKSSGDIIETPIIANFKEGLTVLEYFISTNGCRKGLTDVALKTANSGYLTRRLVDVAQDCIITEADCGTTKGIVMRSVVEGANVIVSLADRIVGRSAAEDILDPVSDKILIPKGALIDENSVELVEKAGIDEVKIRSVLTCTTEGGICTACYGRDLARGTPVNIGEAVGVMAAQSIGEPGTQLTMRTFHIGGAAQGGSEKSTLDCSHAGRIDFRNANIVTNSDGAKIVLSRNCEILIMDDNKRERAALKVQYGARIHVEKDDMVTPGKRLAEWDPYTIPLIAEADGVIHYVDMIEGQSMREVSDETTGMTSRVIMDWNQQARSQDLHPMLSIRDQKGNPILLKNGIEARHFLAVDAIVAVENGAKVKAGDLVARVPRETTKSRDITGGLPRVSELFEARHPKDAAIIAEFDGRIEFGKDYKAKRRINLHSDDESRAPIEYLV